MKIEMKFKIVLFIVLAAIMGCATTGSKELVGSWEIIEFRLIGMGGDPVSTEKILRDAGAVWDMKFSGNGDFSQNFNMRQRDMTMETEEGNWTAFNDSLKIEIRSDVVATNLNYTYKINEDTLVLSLRNPETDSKIITRFRKK
jgi:hypothetical protein